MLEVFKGCKGAVWTDLEVTAVINRKDHVETCQPIPAIYDEEASAASTEPSTSGHFLVFKRVRAAMYKHQAKRFPRLPEHRHDLTFYCAKVTPGIYWYLRRVPTLDCWQPVEPGA
ncbi:hypothetical protein T12_16757 [Trichinella patagoniensis]|uniref:Uncharacterized protein n=1 Tax=Trichinella patagoniensis TaxID=990121 RepID=A0A0V0YYU1_9BILA|nr:hypothetical protein T12_16757 [Trichinella patagoniensis]